MYRMYCYMGVTVCVCVCVRSSEVHVEYTQVKASLWYRCTGPSGDHIEKVRDWGGGEGGQGGAVPRLGGESDPSQ